jgi:hypothetical protein
MPQLKHQVWTSPNGGPHTFVIAGSEADELLTKGFPGEILVFEFFASSYLEAMNIYHEWQGWEPYKPIPGHAYIPYTDDVYNKQASSGHNVPILQG